MERFLKWPLLFLVPSLALAYGGVQRWSVGIMEVIVFLLLFVTMLSSRHAFTFLTVERRLLILAAIMAGLIFLQLVPLPAFIVNNLSSSHTLLSGLAVSDLNLILPKQFSINRGATFSALVEFIAYLSVFLMVPRLFSDRENVKNALIMLAIFGVMISLFGIVQKFTWNGKLFWIKTLESDVWQPFGPFVNPNHFSGFINMIIFPTLALFLYTIRRKLKNRSHGDRQMGMIVLIGFALAVMLSALLLSLSRGGVVAFTFGSLLLLFLLKKEGENVNRSLKIIILGFSSLLLLFLIGTGGVFENLSSFLGIYNDASLAYRFLGWKVMTSIIADFPLMGTGVGTMGDIFTFYRPESMTHTFRHGHNEYLQHFVESGAVGFVSVLLFTGYFFIKSYPVSHPAPSREERYLQCGIYAALASMFIHNLVEFNFRIPANAFLFTLLAGFSLLFSSKVRRRVESGRKLPIFLGLLSVVMFLASSKDIYATYRLHEGVKLGKINLIEDGLRLSSRPDEYGLNAGDYYYSTGQYDAANKSYERALGASPFKAITWAKRGATLDMLDRKEERLKTMITAVRLDPHNPSYRYNAAKMMLHVGMMPEAIKELERIARRDDAWFRTGLNLLSEHEASSESILTLAGDDPTRIVFAASVLERKGALDEAGKAFRKGVSLSPGDAGLLDNYARFLLRQKDYRSLIGLIGLFDGEPPVRVLFWASEGHLNAGEMEKGIELLLKAFERNPSMAEYGEKLSQLYLEKGETSKARETAEMVLTKDRKSLTSYQLMATVFEREEKWLKAAEMLRKAMAIGPGRYALNLRLADNYEKAGAIGLAVKTLEDSLSIRPDDLKVRFRLGDLYKSMGRYGDAYRLYKSVLVMSPSNRDAIDKLSLLAVEQ